MSRVVGNTNTLCRQKPFRNVAAGGA